MNDMPNPRVIMGGNNPPLEETIVMEFDANLREYDFDIILRITELENKAANAGPCNSNETAARYGEAVKSAVAAKKLIEGEREKLNRPILNAQRALMGAAKTYTERLETAEKRIRLQLDDFLDRERKRREEEERERQRKIDEENARIAREAEQERLRLQAIEDEKAERERARLQAIADEEAAVERARLQAIEDERAAAEAREAKAVEVLAPVVEVKAEAVEAPQPAFLDYPTTPRTVEAPIRSDRGVLVAENVTWHVEVENIRQVPDTWLKHASVVEALQKVIAPAVRGKNGLRAIKGCRIYSKTGSSVR